MKNNIFIIAGETSGDAHAANLVIALKKLLPGCSFCGLGGTRMREAGVEIFYDLTEISVVGFVEVLRNLSQFRKIFKSSLQKLDERKPTLVILVDYPGFNLRFAKECKKRNISVIYYISPQVWAWGKNRIKKIKKYVTKMLVVFKFEEEFYKQHDINAKFVGHPLIEDLSDRQIYLGNFRKNNNIPEDIKLIALLPGSRLIEVRRLLPIMICSSKIIKSAIADAKFIIIKAPAIPLEIYKTMLNEFDFNSTDISIIESDRHPAIAESDFAIVASGTATLETALLGTPMTVIYKLSGLTAFFLRRFITIPNIALCNIVAGRKIVEEFVQSKARPELIAEEVLKTLTNSDKVRKIRQELASIKQILGDKIASQNAAEEVKKILSYIKSTI